MYDFAMDETPFGHVQQYLDILWVWFQNIE